MSTKSIIVMEDKFPSSLIEVLSIQYIVDTKQQSFAFPSSLIEVLSIHSINTNMVVISGRFPSSHIEVLSIQFEMSTNALIGIGFRLLTSKFYQFFMVEHHYVSAKTSFRLLTSKFYQFK